MPGPASSPKWSASCYAALANAASPTVTPRPFSTARREQLFEAHFFGVWGSLMQRSIFWMLGLLGYFIYLRMRASAPVLEREREPASAPLPVPAQDSTIT